MNSGIRIAVPDKARYIVNTIRVRNYTVYYIIHDHVMEVRWFRYSPSTRGLVANPEYETSDHVSDV